jgi:hypothetical protein
MRDSAGRGLRWFYRPLFATACSVPARQPFFSCCLRLAAEIRSANPRASAPIRTGCALARATRIAAPLIAGAELAAWRALPPRIAAHFRTPAAPVASTPPLRARVRRIPRRRVPASVCRAARRRVPKQHRVAEACAPSAVPRGRSAPQSQRPLADRKREDASAGRGGEEHGCRRLHGSPGAGSGRGDSSTRSAVRGPRLRRRHQNDAVHRPDGFRGRSTTDRRSGAGLHGARGGEHRSRRELGGGRRGF